ncbi:RagB/SusD family nutrient uptake outer membrane protein [Polaribacter sp.]|uniref:RagB/SusD family nutrient uptake outer membrane protein n=1 Tax=Polaribacter sp. TaxID=1920175 RepID=UPI0025FD951D|nr:RagB/SusD family nutrient uptake outer membrane protein [Polaribacter sp.]
MKNNLKYLLVLSILTIFLGCEALDPLDENRQTFDFVSTDPAFAEGFLLHGYTGLVNQFRFVQAAATDDAVHNQLNNSYRNIATGGLSAQSNPTSKWKNFEKVFYINRFIDILNIGEIQWNRDDEINALFYERMRGEAYALRALHHYYVLQAHAGIGTSGNLLGIPYFKEFIPNTGNFNIPRLSFQESVAAIIEDFNKAIELLPNEYSDSPSKVPAKYAALDFTKWLTVNGSQYNLRVTAKIVKALKARVALFAASPSFLNGSEGYYETAANIASELITDIGGVSGLAPDGILYYDSDSDINNPEILWRGSIGGTNSASERSYFPPSLNGLGQINPSENLVNAFPMQNGYPATISNGYNPQNPYENRDPRLKNFIITNGDSYARGTINTGFGGGIDRLDSIPQLSTRTGYYLKKLLRPDVVINPNGSNTGQRHINVYIRYTELFLILAEAANEIGGPDYQVNGMSARDIISAIRKRAGLAQPDAYLATINTTEQMRRLIQNERRLELCFEGYRFWDLRRWGLDLNETIKGNFFNGTEYQVLDQVEPRNYPNFATYLPIPNSQVIQFSALEQNRGW